MGAKTDLWVLEHVGDVIWAWHSAMLEDPAYAADVLEQMAKRPRRRASADTPTMNPVFICCEPGCSNERKVDKRGSVRRRCSNHERKREVARIRAKNLPCPVPGCTHTRRGVKSYCLGHAGRMARYGDVLADVPFDKGNRFVEENGKWRLKV